MSDHVSTPHSLHNSRFVIGLNIQMTLLVKNLPANAGDTGDRGLIPGSERSPGEGNATTLQYSCLEKSMDREAWQAAARGGPKDSDTAKHTQHSAMQMPQIFKPHLLSSQPIHNALHFHVNFRIK